jgi:hypothetical protein
MNSVKSVEVTKGNGAAAGIGKIMRGRMGLFDRWHEMILTSSLGYLTFDASQSLSISTI